MNYELSSVNVNNFIRDRDSFIDGQIIKIPDKPITIKIKDCTITDELLIRIPHDNISRIILFDSCIFLKSLQYEPQTTQIEALIFKKCSFEENIILRTNTEVKIEEHSNIKGHLNVSGSNGNSFSLKNSEIQGDINITGNFSGSIIIEHINENNNLLSTCTFRKLNSKYLTLKQTSFKKITLEDATIIHNEIIFDSVLADSVVLNHMTIGLLFTLNSSQLQNLSIDNINASHRHIIIVNSAIKESTNIPLSMIDKVNISEGYLSTLRLSGIHNKGSFFNIEKTKIDNLKFDDVFNEGNISIRQIEVSPEGYISIKSSTLGKTDFILCDFTKAKIEFENSKLTELFLSETDFPTVVYVNGSLNYSQAQLFFGQLQTAFQRQGDNVRTLEYQAREIESHYKTIKLLSKDFFKKTNLFLNKISNNFGRYWTYGILFSFIAGALFFYFLIISTKEYTLSLPIEFNQNILTSYLKFMNPLRFFELESIFRTGHNEKAISLNGWSYLWDFLGRVFVAYGFYQTIQAFRRFGKK